MSIYGTLRESSTTPLNDFELTLESYAELQQSIIESYDFFYESEFVDSLNEGANIEYHKAFSQCFKEFKQSMKTVKAYMKSKDYKNAKKELNNARKATKRLEDTLKNVKSNAGSAVFGYFAGGLVSSFQLLIPSLFAGVGSSISMSSLATSGTVSKVLSGIGIATVNVSAIVAYVKEIIITVKDIKQFIEDLDDPDANTADKLNYYRNKIMQFTKDMNKKIDKFEKNIDVLATSQK